MWELPGKNIAFIFSDAAGANACIALANMLQKDRGITATLYSNRTNSLPGMPNVILTRTVPLFRDLGIDCVFTGTSHPESSHYFEVNCIREAMEQGIHTISFIDHWVNFKLRFEGLGGFPDEIWVVDEVARSIAISEGLPEGRILVTGNPYHLYLRQYWKSQYDNNDYLEQLRIPRDGIHILFAPDPLSLRNGKQSAGFTEVDALEDLIHISSDFDRGISWIIKCHPLQSKDNLLKVLRERANANWFFVREADTLELLNAINVVIGFYSNILLDAHAMGKAVIRYFPGNIEADLLVHSNNLKRVRNKQELEEEIKHQIYE